MTAPLRLDVLWSRPEDGTRFAVGQLWREGQEFCFGYDARVADAQRAGFWLLPEFPELRAQDQPYRSAYLFATFAQRIPHPQRPDFATMMSSWGIQRIDDPLEILARSGGIQMTDRLELVEHRPTSDDLDRPLEFRLAGVQHIASSRTISVGDQVSFRREPGNLHDPSAVVVLDADDCPLGYVPRHYSQLFARLLDAGCYLDGRIVRSLVVPESKWVVRASRNH